MIVKNRFQEIEKHDKQFLHFLDGIPYEEVYGNILIDEEIIRKCGYFEFFPNYLFEAYPVAPESFEHVSKNNAISKEDLASKGYCLLHAGCVEVYPYYEKYKKGQNAVITLRAKVFRNEKEFNPIRLNEFTQREIVFIGKDDFINEKIAILQEKALDYANSIGLDNARFETASDMFYPSSKNVVMKKLQDKNGKKLELLVKHNGKDLAISSINFHQNHFSKIFGFDQDGIHSACIGFGIERWIESENVKNGK